MKKLLAIILALSLAFCVCMPSFAYSDVGEDTDMDVFDPMDNLPDGDIDMGELEMETYDVKDLKGLYKTQGRTHYKDGMPSLAYSASSFEFNAYCEGDIYVTFESTKINSSMGNGTYLTVYIDGVKQSRSVGHLNYYGEETAVIAINLNKGNHNVKIVRSTELEPSLVYVKSISLAGEIKAPEQDKDLFIEFVGGAATSAQGALYDKEIALYDPSSAIYQDGTVSFAYKAAESLNADLSVVARQGIGAITGWQKVSMIDVYNYTMHAANNSLLYDFKKQPDIIVVELGAADYDVLKWNNTDKTEEEIIQGFYDMLELLREKNPNAYIVWTYGFNDTVLKDVIPSVIENSGGAKKGFYSVKITHSNGGGKGLPSEAGHTKAATELVDFIKANKLNIPKAPTVKFTPENDDIYSKPPVIELTGIDKLTNKMGYKLYKKGETVPSSFTDYSGSITVNSNGEYVLVVAALDKNNNVGKEAVYEFTYNSAYNPYTVGDLNNDSFINNTDMILLRRLLAGWTVTVIEPAGDVNGDGIVNTRDIMHFARYLAEFEGIELAQ